MNNQNEVVKHHNNGLNVLVGLLVGSIAGAVAMLLMAPQSGKDTRIQIAEKGIQLRDRSNEIVEDVLTQLRSNTNKIAMGGREKIKELKKQGQELVVEQLDHVAEAAQAGKKAILNS